MKTCCFCIMSFAAVLAIVGIAAAQEQYSVLYSFGSIANDGSFPNGGLIFDSTGNVYGTTQQGGSSQCSSGCGTIFELSPTTNGGWSENVLYSFCADFTCPDGRKPAAGLVADNAGNLYGTATGGGMYDGGVVFELSPPVTKGGNWTQSVLWSFGNPGQSSPTPYGRLLWDAEGNLYGTTSQGGVGVGSVFELSPTAGAEWSEQDLYVFCTTGFPTCEDGATPMAGLSSDKFGNLYGTNFRGGSRGDWGVVYELTPPSAGGNWSEKTLYAFQGKSGGNPLSEVNFDDAGQMYVTAFQGNGEGACGSGVQLTPEAGGAGKVVRYLFLPEGTGCNPGSGVLLDGSDGTVYGTTETGGGVGGGDIYEIKGERGRVLYSFCSQSACADGLQPEGSLTEHARKIYSTTTEGGVYGQGVVFQLAP